MKRTQLITTADLNREEVDYLIKEADYLRDKRTDDLKGKIVASLFFEPSTRTRLSFESAILRLGGGIFNITDAKTSSAKKGESLEDSIKVIDSYADIIVMRHPESGSAQRAINVTKKPFINGGDGSNQHPTQALLDIYTIQREMGTIDGLTIGMAGDLKNGRTVHSLLTILIHYDVKIVLISPEKLSMPEKYINLLKENGVEFKEESDLEKNIPELDVLYMTRIQEERFDTPEEYEAVKGAYVLTANMVNSGKSSIRVMHPLPRVDEIDTDVDELEQAAYFRQAENGVYMRMALLKTLNNNFNETKR